MTTPLVTAALKLRGVCLNPAGPDRPGGEKNGEYVLLDVLRPHITGYTIWQTVYHGAEQRLVLLYRFEADMPQAVNLVVLHSGHGVSYDDGNIRHLFLAKTGSGRWVLNNQGEHLQIKNPEGVVVDDRRYGADHCDLIPIARKVIATTVGGSSAAAAAFGSVR